MKNVKTYKLEKCTKAGFSQLYKTLLAFQRKNKIKTFNKVKSPRLLKREIADYVTDLYANSLTFQVKDGKDYIGFICFIKDERGRVVLDLGIKSEVFRYGKWVTEVMRESLALAKEYYGADKIFIIPEERKRYITYLKFLERKSFLTRRKRFNQTYFIYE